jgi:aminoglycoside phosphotransferase (APT) family kinase protein
MAELEQAVAEILTSARPRWRDAQLRPVARGLEFDAFQVQAPDGKTVFLRAAMERYSTNDNDPSVDARRLLEQEAALCEHLAGSGVPVPGVVDLIHGDQGDLLLTEYVADDGSAVGAEEVVDVIGALHRCEPPPLDLAFQEHPSAARTIAARLVRRLSVLADRGLLDGDRIPLSSALTGWASTPGASLLHLDVRRENMLVRNSRLVALVDWTNALIGPPALEFARLAEYGEFDLSPDLFDGVEDAAQLVFRLDAAAMLAVVFVSEAPDPRRAREQLSRVGDLLAQLPR